MKTSCKTLAIDIETYSEADLQKCGVYRYAEDGFTILLLSYAYDDEPVQIVDLACGEALPEQVLWDLTDPMVIKTAFNANFERTCLARYYGEPMPPEQWRCTMVHGLTLGLPGSLAALGAALHLQDQKMTEGKELIRYFCKPCKPTKANGGRTRNLPEHAPDKWALFKTYCKRDVTVERDIRRRLEKIPVPDSEQALWCLDQRMNDRGARVDLDFIRAAIDCGMQYTDRLKTEMQNITQLQNPNSVSQIKDWLREMQGEEIKSLNKKELQVMIDNAEDMDTRRVLEIRQALGKTSMSKYDAMLRSVCGDGRIRGFLQFYGAGRTGRWAGRLVQVQNLPQNKIDTLDIARDLVKNREFDGLEMIYTEPVSFLLSQLVRTAFIADHRFIVSDFSAIEARVIAYLAGEKWRLEVFRGGGDIYCASASQMFGIPVEKHGINGHLRQKGKVAELALGYGGSKGALINMGALDQGLTEEELPEIVQAWRTASPRIIQFWYDMERAAIQCIKKRIPTETPQGIRFCTESGMLFMRLPSGRRLAYAQPRIGENRFGGESILYRAQNQTSKKWEDTETYGGKLVENCVQAFARDVLAESMIRLEARGYPIVMHVHDEVVIDCPQSSPEEVAEIMSEPVSWAPGLPLRADAYETPFYRKD